MDAITICTGTLEIIRKPLAHMLGIAENNHPFITLGANQPQRSLCLFKRSDSNAVLINVRAILLLGLHCDLFLIPLVHP